MGGVIDGQAVNAAVTNPAFIEKNANDVMPYILGFSAVNSPSITDIQNTVNIILDGIGGNQSTPATAYGSLPGNTITLSETHEQALGILARKFFGAASAGGHTHTGVDGDGALVQAVNSVNGFSNSIIIAASGGTSITAIGTTGGSYIYVYSNPLSSATPNSVSPNSSAGTSPSAARYDHAHQGVHSVAVSGSSQLFGDILFAASGVAQVSQSGNTVTVYAPSAGASGAAVNTLNGLSGIVNIAASGGASVSVSGQNIVIYAPTGGNSVSYRAGTVSIASSAASAHCVFSSSMPSTAYAASWNVHNEADSSVKVLLSYKTVKSTSAVDFYFQDTADSGNYSVDYVVMGDL